MNIKMVSVFVSDPIAAFKFYTETLGFKKMLYMPEMQLAIVVSPEQPNGPGLLLEPGNSPVAKAYTEGLYALNLPCIVFGVEDVQKEYGSLLAKGVIFRKTPTKNEWGTEAVFEDGFGNLIQIHQS
jgi:catechol 2,3-dioxygenase-like lactoylglutathione lyase family enzyme